MTELDSIAPSDLPYVTVIILVWGNARRIRRALAGVVGQEYRNIDLCIVHDAPNINFGREIPAERFRFRSMWTFLTIRVAKTTLCNALGKPSAGNM